MVSGRNARYSGFAGFQGVVGFYDRRGFREFGWCVFSFKFILCLFYTSRIEDVADGGRYVAVQMGGGLQEPFLLFDDV